jgi:uncharacterized protein YciI
VAQLYALILRRLDAARVGQILEAHERRLAALHRRGVVLWSGPFEGGGGLTVFQADSQAEAERFVAEDPFVANRTHQPELHAWHPWLRPDRAVAGASSQEVPSEEVSS